MTTPSSKSLLSDVREYALALFNEQEQKAWLFHDYRRATEIQELIADMGSYAELPVHAEVIEVAQLAGWFLSVGKWLDYGMPFESGQAAAAHFLSERGCKEQKTKAVRNALSDNGSTAGAFLHDALLAYRATAHFEQRSPMLRLEEALRSDAPGSLADWERAELQMLLSSQFKTAYGHQVFGPALNQNILRQQQKVDDLQNKTLRRQRAAGLAEKFQGLEPKIPERGNQTFFRAVYQSHIQLSAIADNKANMMTGINTILVSVVISIVTYTSIIHEKPTLTMPIAIFLLTALVSLICSVAAASPRVTKNNKKGADMMDARKNIAYFGNFAHMGLQEFEEAIDAMLRDDELLYGNMSRDLYFLGKVLDRKYLYLRLSYHIFLAGFILSVLLFSYIAFG